MEKIRRKVNGQFRTDRTFCTNEKRQEVQQQQQQQHYKMHTEKQFLNTRATIHTTYIYVQTCRIQMTS